MCKRILACLLVFVMALSMFPVFAEAPVTTSPDTSSPASDTSSPAPETLPSAPDTSAPAPVTSAPAPDTSAPSPVTSAPAPVTSAPSPDTSAPSPVTSAPSPVTSAPAPDTSTPAPDTSTPAPETLPPAPDTLAPSPDTSSPAPETSSPSPETPSTPDALPAVGFYLAQERTAENCVTEYALPRNTDFTLWLMSENGFTLEDAQAASACIFYNLTEYPVTAGVDFEPVARTTDADTTYDIKITVNGDEFATTDPQMKLYEGTYAAVMFTYNTGAIFLSLKLAEKPVLMYRTVSASNGNYTVNESSTLRPFDGYPFSTGKTYIVRLYYGTASSYVPVTDVQIISGSSIKASTLTATDGGPCWQFAAAKVGSSVLQYTCTVDGSIQTGTAPLTVSLPNVGFYTAQERTEKSYITTYTLPQTGDVTLWLMSKNGFTAADVEALSAYIRQGKVNYTVISGMTLAGVPQKTGTGYDIKITLNGEQFATTDKNVKLSDTQSTGVYIQYVSGSLSISLKLAEKPGLMYRTASSSNGSYTVNESNTLRAIEMLSIPLNGSSSVRFYYGTASSYVPVTDVQIISGSSITAATLTATDGGPVWKLTAKALGTSVLQYSYTVDGTPKTGTASLSTALPSFAFYKAEKRTEENYITEYALPQNTEITLWLMSQNGFTAAEVAELSAYVRYKNVDYAITDGVTLEAVPQATGTRYNIKVTINADRFATTNESIKLSDKSYIPVSMKNKSNNTRGSIKLKLAETPSLMYRTASASNGSYIVNRFEDPQPFEGFSLNVANPSALLRFYYGTSTSYVPVTAVVAVSGDSVAVEALTATDGEPVWQLSGKNDGTTVMNYSYVIDGTEKTVTLPLSYGLPEYGLYTQNERDAKYYCSSLRISDSPKTVWFLTAQGFTLAEQTGIAVQAAENGTAISGIDSVWVERTGEPGVYDLMLTLPVPANGSYRLEIYRAAECMISQLITSGAARPSAIYPDDDIVVGFAHFRNDILYVLESDGPYLGSSTTRPPSTAVPYAPFYDFRTNPAEMGKPLIVAATIKEDAMGAKYYERIDNASIKVTGFRIEPISGAADSFSLCETEFLGELSGDFTEENWPTIYFKSGVTARVFVCATVEAKVNGKTVAGEIRMTCKTDYYPSTSYDCTELGILTVDELNRFLVDLGAMIDPRPSTTTYYTVTLAETDYVGTVKIPGTFSFGNYLYLQGKSKGTTRLIGGIDLGGSTPKVQQIRNITFIAPADASGAEVRAVYNGGTGVQSCVFYGYDVALDASPKGVMIFNQSVFINNEIGVRFDMGTLSQGRMYSASKRNTFINNQTAVQILTLNDFLSPYYLRIYDSNFIGNGTDIDARSGGTIYLYCNYFGEYKQTGGGHVPTPGKPGNDKHNGPEDLRMAMLLAAKTEESVGNMLHHRPPKIEKANKTKIVTNPRWKYPVLNWWTGTPLETLLSGLPAAQTPALLTTRATTYTNILVADWDMPTVIDNAEADTLLLDGSAFDTETESKKQVDVVDASENTLGSWIFD